MKGERAWFLGEESQRDPSLLLKLTEHLELDGTAIGDDGAANEVVINDQDRTLLEFYGLLESGALDPSCHVHVDLPQEIQVWFNQDVVPRGGTYEVTVLACFHADPDNPRDLRTYVNGSIPAHWFEISGIDIAQEMDLMVEFGEARSYEAASEPTWKNIRTSTPQSENYMESLRRLRALKESQATENRRQSDPDYYE